jgi:guanyl-specific ribonuclease Sa
MRGILKMDGKVTYSSQEGNALGNSGVGGVWKNTKGQLPTHDASGNAITYKEFDINPLGFNGRDSYRFITGSDGNTYYTADHHTTFYKVR